MDAILFLDVDGVINPTANLVDQKNKGNSTLGSNIIIPDEMLLRIKRILDETHAYLVISSSWRNRPGEMKNLTQQFERFGVCIHSTTRLGNRKHRGHEILDWFVDNNMPNCAYMVLDDDAFDIKEYVPENKFIQTSGYIGLTDEQVQIAIDSINKQKSDFYNSFVFEKKDIYETKDEAIKNYKIYIANHIAAVQYVAKNYGQFITKAFCPGTTNGHEKLVDLCRTHDESKYTNYEFENYRLYFFKSKEDNVTSQNALETMFNQSWKHHYETNFHHPEYWSVHIGNVKRHINMNLLAFCEMICDWIAMSLTMKQSLYDWWFEKGGRSGKVKFFSNDVLDKIDSFITTYKDSFDFTQKQNM